MLNYKHNFVEIAQITVAWFPMVGTHSSLENGCLQLNCHEKS